jgi:hypothetical protein
MILESYWRDRQLVATPLSGPSKTVYSRLHSAELRDTQHKLIRV